MPQYKNSRDKNSRFWNWVWLVPLFTGGAILVSGHCVFAQITPDDTLGAERSLVRANGDREQIDGGVVRGNNLFHSFRAFNIRTGQSVYFQNPAGIENIIGRITGRSPSHIRGTLGVSGGNANLFLLNPNGIIFGPNARLDVGGSFVSTTANAIQFGDRGFFSSSNPTSPPLLTVNPSAFFFNQVAHGAIVNRSTAPLATEGQGLQVPNGRSLLLLGGDINLAGGQINVFGGRVELAGVTGAGTVGLSVDNNDLRLSFLDRVAQADISLTDAAQVDVSGEGRSAIQLQGRNILLSDGSRLVAINRGRVSGRSLSLNASDTVELSGFAESGVLTTLALDAGNAGDIVIDTQNFIVRDGAQIITSTESSGSAGQLRVNASESVEVAGFATINDPMFGKIMPNTGLFSATLNTGDAGNLIINTRRLSIRNRGAILAAPVPVLFDERSRSVTGQGGNITINASESFDLTEGQILTRSPGSGRAGNITIHVRDTLQVSNSSIASDASQSSGGSIEITADAIRLRENSDISTTVSNGTGDGGNITLRSGSIFAFDDSDILAFSLDGRGGDIVLDTPAFFGFRYTPAPPDADPEILGTNNDRVDINAQGGLGSGTIILPELNPTQGLVELSVEVTDATRLISQVCPSGSITTSTSNQQGQFVVTGRGGLPPEPSEILNGDAVQVDLVDSESTESESTDSEAERENRPSQPIAPTPLNSLPDRIVEAQGWAIGADGEIVLTAANTVPVQHTRVECH
jgi:filamentous hemagglutinin family protein